ncbi:MAG: hypothetical protein HPY50_01260 [Firmicutes bacterium]|nr:hypothetical protein [Bacillota bacterium]
MRLRKKGLIHTTALAILLAALMWAGTGCQLFETGQQPAAENMIKVEVHFTGGSQPLVGYFKSLNFEQDGMFYQGGASTIPMYDEQGNQTALVNLGRVEYIKILP